MKREQAIDRKRMIVSRIVERLTSDISYFYPIAMKEQESDGMVSTQVQLRQGYLFEDQQASLIVFEVGVACDKSDEDGQVG